MIKKFEWSHLDNFEPDGRKDNAIWLNVLRTSTEYREAIDNKFHLYTIFNGETPLLIFGGIEISPTTAEVLMIPSSAFKTNMLKCIKILRRTMGADRDKYFPPHIYRLEANCSVDNIGAADFDLLLGFKVIGVRTKYGQFRGEDNYLLERILD